MITESIRLSLPLVEAVLTIGTAFVIGFVVGWWVRGR